MTLIGIGVDLIEVERIRRLAKKNKRFLPRVFTADEIRYCRTKKNQWQHFAARFAAKEAAWKALGEEGVGWRDIVVAKQSTGKPTLQVKHASLGAVLLHISLSHTEHYATAMVLAYKK